MNLFFQHARDSYATIYCGLEIIRFFLLFGGLLRFQCTWSCLPTSTRVFFDTPLTFFDSPGLSCAYWLVSSCHGRGWSHVVCFGLSEMKTSVPEEINHMPSWSDASDCTTAVLEDLYGWVFYFLCVRSLRFSFSGSRSCLVFFVCVEWVSLTVAISPVRSAACASTSLRVLAAVDRSTELKCCGPFVP